MSNIFQQQNQMIIRFPQEIADELHKYFNEGGNQPEVSLEVDPNRKEISPRISLNVGVNGNNYKATVVELPTITSSFKTIDRINFFKSNDISEMIVVHENQFDVINQSEAEEVIHSKSSTDVNKKDKTKKYLSESGITEPTVNIRQNNFRQRAKVDVQKVEEVDKALEGIKQEFTNQGKQEERNEKNKKKKQANQ